MKKRQSPRAAEQVAARSVLDGGGKRSATPLWNRVAPVEKRRRRCALPAQSKTWRTLVAALLLLSALNVQLSAQAQDTAFTYQGRFNANNAPYAGSAEFQFTLWDAASGGNAVATNHPASIIATVADGLFTATLDFGSNPFNGQPRFLQIETRTAIGAFTPLTPRQPLTPTPYALRALNLATNGLAAGTYANAVTFNNAGNSFNGSHGGNGAGLTSVNAATLDGLGSAGFWKSNGNTGANPANGAFLGTTDNQPLELRVNGQRALRLEPKLNDTANSNMVNIVAGSLVNSVAADVYGATIGGGGAANYKNYGAYPQTVAGDFGTIGGGWGNSIGSNSIFSTISGGSLNAIQYQNGLSVIGGGDRNTVQSDANQSVIGGGALNSVQTSASDSTISGGSANTVQSNALCATIAGGCANTNLSGAYYGTVGGGGNNIAGGQSATVPGGFLNTAAGAYSFAAGRQAKANHDGAFVWADGAGGDFPSQRANQFRTRAGGGARFDINNGDWVDIFRKLVGTPPFTILKVIDTSTGAYLSGGGAWTDSSDRKAKENFQEVGRKEILERVIRLPITSWDYKVEGPSVRHIGPVAQDFHEAFRLSADDKHIAPLDANGVALAAIQGLNEKVEVRSARAEDRSRKLEEKLEQKETEITELKQRLEALERIIRLQKSN